MHIGFLSPEHITTETPPDGSVNCLKKEVRLRLTWK